MSDLMLWGTSIGLAAAASAVSAFATRAASRAPLLARISALGDDLAREAAAARRREAESASQHASKERHLRTALGLSAVERDGAPPRGRALAEQLVERLHGLASVDRCIVADAQGLAWTSDGFDEAAGLAASAGAALTTLLRGSRPRSLHVELADARHIVVRPVPGTLPELALATLSTSRATSPFALDAVLAHASLLTGAESDGDDGAIVGWASRASRGDAPVTVTIARELEDASPSVTAGAMALLMGDEVIAAFGTDGPRQEDLSTFAVVLRDALARIENRMGARARRIDWVGSGGAAISLAPLGASRRTSVLVARRGGPVDGGAFDRLGGRLRRLLPADPSPPTSLEVRP